MRVRPRTTSGESGTGSGMESGGTGSTVPAASRGSTLAGRRAMLIGRAGGRPSHYGPRGINGPIDDLLFPIHHGVLFYPGYDVLPPFVVYRADRRDEAAFDATATALRHRMRLLFETVPIPFRRQNGGDYAIPAMELNPQVVRPDLTGFAAHIDG